MYIEANLSINVPDNQSARVWSRRYSVHMYMRTHEGSTGSQISDKAGGTYNNTQSNDVGNTEIFTMKRAYSTYHTME